MLRYACILTFHSCKTPFNKCERGGDEEDYAIISSVKATRSKQLEDEDEDESPESRSRSSFCFYCT